MLNKAGIWMTGSPDRPQCLTTLLAVHHNSATVRDGDSNAPGGRNAQCINQLIAHLIISGSATLTAVAPQYHSRSVCAVPLQQYYCPASNWLLLLFLVISLNISQLSKLASLSSFYKDRLKVTDDPS